jgi:hypothetical protein
MKAKDSYHDDSQDETLHSRPDPPSSRRAVRDGRCRHSSPHPEFIALYSKVLAQLKEFVGTGTT